MKELIITFDQTFDMMESEKLLTAKGIPIRVMGLPSQLGAGCGLCLRLNTEDFEKGVLILNQANIPTAGFYQMARIDGRPVYKPFANNFSDNVR